MKRALMGIDSQKEKQKAKIVDAEKLRLPNEKPSSMQKYAFHDRMMGGIAPVFVRATPSASSRGITPYDQTPRWKFEKPKLPSKQPPKKSAFPFLNKRNQRLCIPTHRLNNAASQVMRAPRALVEDYKLEARPSPSTFPSKSVDNKPSQPSKSTGGSQPIRVPGGSSRLPPSPAISPSGSVNRPKTMPTATPRIRKITKPPSSTGAYASPPEDNGSKHRSKTRTDVRPETKSTPPPPPPQPVIKRKRPSPESALLVKPKRTKVT